MLPHYLSKPSTGCRRNTLSTNLGLVSCYTSRNYLRIPFLFIHFGNFHTKMELYSNDEYLLTTSCLTPSKSMCCELFF